MPDEPGRTTTHDLVTPSGPSWRTTLACTCGERFIDKASHRAHVRKEAERGC